MGTEYKKRKENNMGNIDIKEMFDRYIEKKRAVRKETHGTYNEAWLAGEAHELEYWLRKCGVDTSYEVTEPIISGEQAVKPPLPRCVVRYSNYAEEDEAQVSWMRRQREKGLPLRLKYSGSRWERKDIPR